MCSSDLQLGELLGGKPQAAAVDQRQGDGPERLIRTQQPRVGRHRRGRRFGAGWGKHGAGEHPGLQAKGGAGMWTGLRMQVIVREGLVPRQSGLDG